MDRRLVGCVSAALLLHVSLAALGALGSTTPGRAPHTAAETSLELLPFAEEKPRAPPVPEEPASAVMPPPAPPAALAARPRPRAELAPLAALDAADAEPTAGHVPELAAPLESPEPSLPPARRLSLAELGLTGRSAALQPPLPDAPPKAAQDVAGLKRALTARDVALGLGPGGAVASQLRIAAQELAPLGSQATISVDLSRDGSVDTVWLDDVTSSEQDWRKVLRAFRLRLGQRAIASGPVRVTLLVTSRSTKRAGNSDSLLEFDVSNIGSPTLHTVHVRVLAQSPL
jgi:hypothetical protein